MAKTRRRKKRTHRVEAENAPAKKSEPRTFVFRRGRHGLIMADLEKDLRKMMLPNTALNLKESKRNTMSDFVSVAGPLGVSHFMILTATETASHLKVAKSPRGPTLSMRVESYSLMRDVASSQSRPRVPQHAFKTAPLVILNNFGGAEHMKVASVLLQNMFPSINVHETKPAACQRVVLLSYIQATGTIRLRHYSIGTAPSKMKKSITSLVRGHDVPDLSHMQDVSEYVSKGGYGSESEGEDAEDRCAMPVQELMNSKVAENSQSRVRLYEIGPRLELKMVKLEEGMCTGRVLYHSHIKRSDAEVKSLQAQHEARASVKAARRQEQEQNVAKKAARKAEQEEHATEKKTKRQKTA